MATKVPAGHKLRDPPPRETKAGGFHWKEKGIGVQKAPQ